MVTKKTQPFQCCICARWQQIHNPPSVAYEPSDTKPQLHVADGPGDNKTFTLPVWHMCLVTAILLPSLCGTCARWQLYHYPSSVAYVHGDKYIIILPVWLMCHAISTCPVPHTQGQHPRHTRVEMLSTLLAIWFPWFFTQVDWQISAPQGPDAIL